MTTTLTRTGPLRDAQQGLGVRWTALVDTQTAAAFAANDAHRLQEAGVGDLSCKRRAGVKGPGAEAWLQTQGLPTPAQPNSWVRAECDSIVARLGLTEYAIVAGPGTSVCEQISRAVPPRVYPVPRYDAELLLAGRQVHDLLKQTCAFDFESLDPATRPVVMTSMVGVGVTVLAFGSPQQRYYRLWCDGTYGPYLWNTLVEVADSLDGGAVGSESLGLLAR
jgi:sarcosine oxidase subunit gamma